MLKILNVSYSDFFGGAAKSAYRINNLLNEIPSIESKMLVIKKISRNKNVIKFGNKKTDFFFKIKNYVGMMIGKLDNNPYPTSYNFFKSPIIDFINNSDYHLVNLHWINAEMISIFELNKLQKPYLITLHDMWWICGSENYLTIFDKSWKDGGFTNLLSKKIWNLKKQLNPIGVVAPSKWLYNCTKLSPITNKSKIINIPYPVDFNIYKPQKINNLKKYNLFKNTKIKILFIVFGNPADSRKGLDLLLKALNIIKNKKKFELIIVGKDLTNLNFNIQSHHVRFISNEKELSKIYNLSDLVLIPSRIDNLPNVALEAQACGKPIISFDVGGMKDIIKHNYNGYLVKPYDIKKFSYYIEYLITNKRKLDKLSSNSIKFSRNLFSKKKIKILYKNFLKQII